MADLQYSVGVDASQGVRSLDQFNGRVGALEGVIKKANSGGGLGRVVGGGVLVGGVATLGALVKRGFDFNGVINDSKVAIANVLAQFQGLNAEAAKGAADAAMAKIIELEPKAAGSLKDLTSGFLATLAASQSAGLSVDQNVDLVGKFSNALANANIPAEQLAQEMRSILTGNIGADSSLAKVLNIKNEDIQKAAQAGQLYDYLVTRLGKLGESGDSAAVAWSTLNSAIDKAAGLLAQGLFTDAIAGAKELTNWVNQNAALFTNLGKVIGGITQVTGAFLSNLNKSVMLVMALRDALPGVMNGKPIMEAIEKAMIDVETAVKSTDVAFAKLGTTTAATLTPATAAADKLATALAAVNSQAKGTQTQPSAPGGGGGGGEAEPSEGGRKKIMGYSAERQGGRDAARARANARMEAARARIDKSRTDNFGGINEFNALQSVQLSGDNEGQRAFSAFGGESGRLSAAEAGRRVGAFREGGATPGDSAAFGRIQDALAPPGTTPGAGQTPAAPLTSPEMIERLDAVIAELQKMNQ